MASTQDYEHLLKCANVIGVDYDDRTGRVTVFVSQKLRPEELDDEDDIEKRLADEDVEVEVIDAGYGEERSGYDALSILEPVPEAAPKRMERHRPVPAGVSEINVNSTAATAGPYPARVVEPSAGAWSDDAEAGDPVRIANNHTYARINEAEFGEAILQPSPEDGGGPDDEVGELAGYVPIEDGVQVDAAARTADPEREAPVAYELDESWPTGIRREEYGDLRGETVTKSGRTTGVTSAAVEATNATVEVNFGPEGTVTLREQLIAGYMSEGGDSGSAVFHEDGDLVGLLFAGSAEQTICNRIGNVEADLGVEFLTEEPGDGGDGGDSGEEPPVFVPTDEATVSADLEGPELSIEAITFDSPPEPGETATLAVEVTVTAAGIYWLEVGEERQTFDLEGEEATIEFDHRIEDDIKIRIRGGRVE